MPWISHTPVATPRDAAVRAPASKYDLNSKVMQGQANQGVNIAGVAVLMNGDAAIFRRCVWGTTLLLCLVTLIVIFGERFAYFLSFPVIVDVQVIHNSSLKFPAITACPATSGNDMAFNVDPEALRKVYEQTVGDSYPGFQRARHVLERQLDTKELWDSTAWNISAMVEKCYQGRGLFCSEVGQFRLTYTIFGPCITYAGRPATLAGSYHGLYLRLRAENRTGVAEGGGGGQDLAGWWVVVHEAEDDPSLLIKTHGYFVAFKWNKEIIVSLKHFEALDTHRKPCNDDPAYRSSQCITQCFSRSFIKVLRCRLPFMSGDVPYCRGVKMSERVSKHLDVMLLQGAWQPSRCNCATPCKQTIYEYRGDTTDDRNDSNGRVKVFFLDLMYEQVKEEFSYPFASLVADFGGMMGLLLGASLLTLVEVMEFVTNYLLRVYHKRKATQETRRALTYTEVSTLDTLKGFGEVFLPRPAFLTSSGQGRSLPCVDCDGASARAAPFTAPN